MYEERKEGGKGGRGTGSGGTQWRRLRDRGTGTVLLACREYAILDFCLAHSALRLSFPTNSRFPYNSPLRFLASCGRCGVPNRPNCCEHWSCTGHGCGSAPSVRMAKASCRRPSTGGLRTTVSRRITMTEYFIHEYS